MVERATVRLPCLEQDFGAPPGMWVLPPLQTPVRASGPLRWRFCACQGKRSPSRTSAVTEIASYVGSKSAPRLGLVLDEPVSSTHALSSDWSTVAPSVSRSLRGACGGNQPTNHTTPTANMVVDGGPLMPKIENCGPSEGRMSGIFASSSR